ncbi:hypothetical protein KEJ37_03465 [Candidatus Bathyarchaeota archaeon]|nr:hypothetical protein [Candidatus Bathyarchaeota archaeon]
MSNLQNLAIKHYSRADVQKEIAEFCKGRWMAAHCVSESGKLVFKRYLGGKPMAVESEEEFAMLLKGLKNTARTFYATANKYPTVERIEDVDLSKAYRCTPTWDIDGTLQNWRETIAVAKEILSLLENEGVKNSAYMKWSGNGCHIHIHEEAISEAVTSKAHPLDFAYAIVEYINAKALPKITESLKAGVKVENRMDAGRVFTCPLSLHRQLDVVCVCLKPDEADSFSPEWIQPSSFRHNTAWRDFKEGEADTLALKAYETVGGYPMLTMGKRRRVKSKKLDECINEFLQRF